MFIISIVPANARAAFWALQLFGEDKVNVGSWAEPVYAQVEDNELQPAQELFKEMGYEVEVKAQRKGKL